MKFKNLAIAGALAAAFFSTAFGANEAKAAATPASQDLIIINDFYNKLAFFDNGIIKYVEPVAMGKKSTPTPKGTFSVTHKIVNRPYYTGKIPGGSPKNPLGVRWLGLSIPGGAYGIHGHAVGNESSIGNDVSNGCVRLLNSTNAKLYPHVNVGTKVIIVNSPKSFKQLAIDYKYTKPAPAPKQTVVKARFIGWADSQSFEVKTPNEYMVIRKGSVNTSGLKSNVTYTFTYTKNQYGQNILNKYTK